MPPENAYQFSRDVNRYLNPGTTYDPLRQPLYDRVVQATPATGTIQFFQVPVGQAGKTELDTNMRLAGQIPSNHVFECWSPRIIIAPISATTAADVTVANSRVEMVHDLIFGSFIRMRIVSQEKLLVPTFFLPAAAGVSASVALIQALAAGATAAANFQVANNGMPTNESAARLDPFPIIIPPLQTFTFEMTFPVNVVLPENVNIWVVLDGILHRPALP